ncbi:type VII secretion protein EccB [Actinomadura sp. DC4]|uniref:type VII secretion protein EccB n=1 Tax=Actinomadura sp. DC4 TaxID=3055069 RepID=UPI0025B0DE0F|nr:type VII secretion protein EccB [Actinomadura sp. DC4]MDN3354810.1 type VII secretion protein EccB [Actinomadura sp. DC4]
MQSRRDQVQAHLFVMGRITSGMLRADPDAPESPQGRTNRGTVAGIVVAVLLCAAAFVWGLISPGKSNSWRDSQSLIVDQDTGASYLYVDGRLRPVRNYASARLIGGTKMKTRKVRTKSLNGAPHGQPVGIIGAPDALPSPGDLSQNPWAVCSGTGDTGTNAPITTLAVGVSGAEDSPLTAGEGMLVIGPDSAVYLVWQGSRLRLNQKGGAMSALGYAGRLPAPVSAAFLDALPAGPDLTAPAIPGMGTAGPVLDGHASRVGQVFRVGVIGSDPRYYQLRQNGLTEVSATVADMLLADAQVRRLAYGGRSTSAVPLAPDALNQHLAPADQASSVSAMPETPPRLVDRGVGEDACVRIAPGGTGPRVSVVLATRASLGLVAQAPTATACVPVERITVPPGGGTLVRALAADGGTGAATTYLVTDTGTKFRVATSSDLVALGYSAGEAVALPSPLLAMVPSGPELSSAAAESGTSPATTEPCGGPRQGGDKSTTSQTP